RRTGGRAGRGRATGRGQFSGGLVAIRGGRRVVVPATGEVVIVPFPFSDLSQNKVRPAICLAAAGRGDWVLCQVTSNPYGDPLAISIDATSYSAGGLKGSSFARPGKLFTANAGLMIRSVGRLNDPALRSIVDAVVALLRPAAP